MNALEVEPIEEQQALTIREPKNGSLAKIDRPLTAQEMRVQEVNEALLPAYQKASTLELSEQEIAALQEPFPDELVEIRPHDGLIYIPHIHISNRLNKVLSPGKWSLVKRHHWLEGNTLYGEYVLLIRGCYVGESVGGHPYQPNNPKVNYSDTLESTAAEALRRIAGKRLSCGSQVWEPEYARQWCDKHAVQLHGKWQRKFGKNAQEPPKTAASAPATRQQPPTQVKTAPAKPDAPKAKEATEATKAWFLKEIADMEQPALQYLIETGKLLPNEPLTALSLVHVPTSRADLVDFRAAVETFKATGTTKRDDPDYDAEDAPWRFVTVPFGKNAGKELGTLPKNTLYGFWANHTVQTEYKGKPLAADRIEADQIFRDALDDAGKHYQFTSK